MSHELSDHDDEHLPEESPAVHPQTSAAISQPWQRRQTSLGRQLDYDEAEELLASQGIHLFSIIGMHVQRMLRLGLVDLKDAHDYKSSFRKIRSCEASLRRMFQLRRENPSLHFRAIVQAQWGSLDEWFEKLIKSTGIPFHDWLKLSAFERVDPITKQPVSEPQPAAYPRIVFTPEMSNIKNRNLGKSANQLLREMFVEGHEYLDPRAWMEYFLQTAETGVMATCPNGTENLSAEAYRELIKDQFYSDERVDAFLLDNQTGTLFPDFQSNGGSALTLRWLPTIRKVDCDAEPAETGNMEFGPRLVFG